MHNVRMVSMASLSMGSLSSAGNSVLVWVMVHLPRYAASSVPQGQLPSIERYRYPQSAERLPSGPMVGPPEGVQPESAEHKRQDDQAGASSPTTGYGSVT